MFKNFFPNKILSLSNNLLNSLLVYLILIMFLGLIYSLYISPPDYIQGDSVRIMYVLFHHLSYHLRVLELLELHQF